MNDKGEGRGMRRMKTSTKNEEEQLTGGEGRGEREERE